MNVKTKRPKHYTLHVPRATLLLLNDFNRHLSDLQKEGYVIDIQKAPKNNIDKLEFANTSILLMIIEHVMRNPDLLMNIFVKEPFSLRKNESVSFKKYSFKAFKLSFRGNVTIINCF